VRSPSAYRCPHRPKSPSTTTEASTFQSTEPTPGRQALRHRTQLQADDLETALEAADEIHKKAEGMTEDTSTFARSNKPTRIMRHQLLALVHLKKGNREEALEAGAAIAAEMGPPRGSASPVKRPARPTPSCWPSGPDAISSRASRKHRTLWRPRRREAGPGSCRRNRKRPDARIPALGCFSDRGSQRGLPDIGCSGMSVGPRGFK